MTTYLFRTILLSHVDHYSGAVPRGEAAPIVELTEGACANRDVSVLGIILRARLPLQVYLLDLDLKS